MSLNVYQHRIADGISTLHHYKEKLNKMMLASAV